jgi:5-methylcytosine-specific restriction endonuclease McrA
MFRPTCQRCDKSFDARDEAKCPYCGAPFITVSPDEFGHFPNKDHSAWKWLRALIGRGSK